MTADLALKRADEFFKGHGGLRGRTVFIPGALSGVGSIALQIAKHRWKCHTLSAVSTSKISQIGKCLGEDVVDEVYDYTKVNVTKEIGKHKVDFVFDTTGLAGEYIPMLKNGGFCLSIARLPPGSALKSEDPDAPHQSRLACIGQNVMDGMDAAFRTWAKTMHGVTYVYQKTDPDTADLQAVSELVQNGELKAVVGKTASFEDVEEVKSGCMGIFKGKGAIGKFVVTMDK
jgi:NADPH:quinone reductase-like Zn-dependent oxidoreductase